MDTTLFLCPFPISPFFQINMNLLHLPKELKLCIAAYFNDTEKIEFGSCCVGFSNEFLMNHLRHFKIQNRSNFLSDYESNEEVRQRFAKCIRFPGSQVHVSISKFYSNEFIPFPRIYSLNVSFEKLQQLLLHNKIEKIQTLNLRIPPSSVNSSQLILTKNYGIKNLTIFNYGVSVDSLPIFPPRSLESLTWRGPCLIPHSRFNDAFSHLHELEFIDVDAVSDVRMFVQIKKLSLFACHNITDITTTNDTNYYHRSLRKNHGLPQSLDLLSSYQYLLLESKCGD